MSTNFTMLVHDRPLLTTQALTSLAKGDLGKLSISILDDASREATQSVLRMWKSDHMDTLVARNDVSNGTGSARNQVIKMSEVEFGRGAHLYLSDNDVFFHPKWHEKLIACYEEA